MCINSIWFKNVYFQFQLFFEIHRYQSLQKMLLFIRINLIFILRSAQKSVDNVEKKSFIWNFILIPGTQYGVIFYRVSAFYLFSTQKKERKYLHVFP